MMSVLPLLSLALPLLQDKTPEEQYDLLQSVERVTPVVRVVQAVTPAVVYVETESVQRVLTMFGGARERTAAGSGSGAVVHPDGYIVTNYHVVKGAKRIRVSFEADPMSYVAQLVSYVQAEDLALLKIEAPEPFPTIRLGTSADLWPGERVVAIGNPHGQTHTVSTGIISGLHRNVQVPEQGLDFRNLLQTDASINLGNSGGPLLNIRGEMIGINTAMNRAAENIGFAIPVDRVREVLTDILYPNARKSWLGFDVAPGEALAVSRVWSGSPASLAGICEGDRVVAVGGQRVSDADEFLHATLELQPQREVELVINRGGREEAVRLETWDRLDGVTYERLGMTVRERVVGRRSMVLVEQIRDEGPAADLGLEPGDWLAAVIPQGYPYPVYLRGRETLAQLLGHLEAGQVLQVDLYRDDDQDRQFQRDELYKGPLLLH